MDIIDNTQKKIYLVDDDKNISEMLSVFLEKEGYSVTFFTDGESFLSACTDALPDLAVLDIMLPGMDGLSVLSRFKQLYPQLPIIIISARDSSYDRVAGFSLGCDDYIIKPFLPLELVFRARALLKHSSPTAVRSEPEPVSKFCFGPLTLYSESRTARLDNESFPLSPTEFDFLSYLIRHNGAAVKREELLSNIWQVSWDANTRVADDLVKRLRRKFRYANSPVRIETIWGYGFRIALGDSDDQENQKEQKK